MQIQVSSDSHISAGEEFIDEIKTDMEQVFHRFAQQLTRLEVHLSDENSHKSGARDKRCLIEARLAGMDPIAVAEHAESLDLAISNATEKLEKTLDRTLGRLDQKKGRVSFAGDQEI
ncbi:MAG: HPF/RaiA family ribosome-associated protein [Pirellulales bacterium]